MTEQLQAALEILRRAQNPFAHGSAEHWALEIVLRGKVIVDESNINHKS